jgi:hypothetical protein
MTAPEASGRWKNGRTVPLSHSDPDRPDTYTVSLKVTRKGSGNVMNLRTLTLAP